MVSHTISISTLRSMTIMSLTRIQFGKVKDITRPQDVQIIGQPEGEKVPWYDTGLTDPMLFTSVRG